MNLPITVITPTPKPVTYKPIYALTTLEQAFDGWEDSSITVSLFLNQGLEGRQHLLSFEAEFDDMPYQVAENIDDDGDDTPCEKHSIQYYTNDELHTIDLPNGYIISKGLSVGKKMVQIRTKQHIIVITKGGR
ncbi:hypothetical protein KD909_15150 (plasmid) [Exiguobacterium sp. PFWT01]|uniref:hypothetical protein n=1 Tax=Exiguobacterium sp. PFWT01 TaxID=2829816 RepID=UPI001BA8BBF9|nr:hypothetical protein [Exiguobacterium sp. PFWT01]QUP88697.1 hypothetical protein KD909_15150 [Exiguobacterium sp. PFWT01]